MLKYLAKYTIKAAMFDGGAWMPDPETHHQERHILAEDDADAKKRAEGYKSEVGKGYYGPSVSLDSLIQMKEVALADDKPLSRDLPKKIVFDEKLEFLVDESGAKYLGRRFATVSALSHNKVKPEDAEEESLLFLLKEAGDKSADAYEEISSHLIDDSVEYAPCYTVRTNAILYKK